jgi:hypothetical protein
MRNSPSRVARILTLSMPFAVAACGPSGPEAVMSGAASVDVRTVPFPSDAMLGSDGKAQVSYPLPFSAANDADVIELAATLSEADGFSTTGSIFFPVSADVVVDSGATARLIDLDDPMRATAYPLFYRSDTKQLVAMAPVGTALLEHHQYGCYITGGVHGVKGGALHPSATMSDAIAGRGRFGAHPSYQKLAAALAKLMVKPIAATAFTTQTVSAWASKAIADLIWTISSAASPRARAPVVRRRAAAACATTT